MKTLAKSIVALTVGASLTACGGGGGDDLASGGISGTGSGTITGFGSIILNDRGKFESESAEVRIDDDLETENELEEGMVVEVEVENADDDFATGTATQIRVTHEIKGPVTSISPLKVLGQELVITGDTVIINANDSAIGLDTFTENLNRLDEWEVSGRRDNTGVIQVSRLEDKAKQLTEWKLMGDVSGLPGSTFTIGSQKVDFSGVTIQDCGSSLTNGSRVEVKARKPSTFPADATLAASEVECKPDALTAPANLTGTIQGEFEGFVTAVNGTSSFTLGDQTVTRSASTTYEGGTAEDLVAGVKLDAKGIFNIDTGVLDASRIRFRETRFRIEGPLPSPAPALDANSITMLENEIKITAQTEVDSDAFSNTGVRVRGFVDSDGTLFANEVDDRSDADLRLRGRVDSITGTSSFELLGITVDMDSATQFRIEDVSVDKETFVAALETNSEVDVKGGTLGGTTISGADELTIENAD